MSSFALSFTSLVRVLMVIMSSSALPLPSWCGVPYDANPTLTQSFLRNSFPSSPCLLLLLAFLFIIFTLSHLAPYLPWLTLLTTIFNHSIPFTFSCLPSSPLLTLLLPFTHPTTSTQSVLTHTGEATGLLNKHYNLPHMTGGVEFNVLYDDGSVVSVSTSVRLYESRLLSLNVLIKSSRVWVGEQTVLWQIIYQSGVASWWRLKSGLVCATKLLNWENKLLLVVIIKK